jgi:hypothetical protein
VKHGGNHGCQSGDLDEAVETIQVGSRAVSGRDRRRPAYRVMGSVLPALDERTVVEAGKEPQATTMRPPCGLKNHVRHGTTGRGKRSASRSHLAPPGNRTAGGAVNASDYSLCSKDPRRIPAALGLIGVSVPLSADLRQEITR